MSNLQFQSFTNQNFDMSDESPGRIGDGSTQEEAATTASGPRKNFFSFAFYQQYFDVDTDQVQKRLVNSVIPTHKNFITEYVQPIPDLYGPFWVCCTLVFSIGIFSNIAQYIENQGTAGEYGSDFRMVTGASSLIASYVLIIPFIISTTLWYRKADIQYSFLEVVCAYGYSLAIFIPVSMLWVIDISILRWALIFISVALSGGVLVRSLAPAFANDPNKIIALGSVILVIVLHFGLALCFKEYFFDAAMPSKAVVPSPTTAAAPPVTVPGTTIPPSVLAGNGTKPESSALKVQPTDPTTAAIAAVTNATTTVAAAPAANSTTVAAGGGGATNGTVAADKKSEAKKEAPLAPIVEPAPNGTAPAAPAATAAAAAVKPETIDNRVPGVLVKSPEPTVIPIPSKTEAAPPKTNSSL